MNSNKLKSNERLSLFSELYEAAKLAGCSAKEEMERHMRQYNGESEIDGSSESATVVRNITYELIESQINSDVPAAKAEPIRQGDRYSENAREAEQLCAAVRDRLPFEDLNDCDERYTYVYGCSVWYVEWDNTAPGGDGFGAVRVHCLSPLDFFGQPGVDSVKDMEYCFLRFTTTKGALERKYRLAKGQAELAQVEYRYGGESMNDTVSMICAFYRDESGEIGKFVFSGELVLEDIPNYYMRKLAVCGKCSSPVGECKCKGSETKLVDMPIERVAKEQLPFESQEDALLPYYTPKSFPIVIRYNRRSSPITATVSDCAVIRHQQQAINKVESRIIQKLLRAGITPVIPEDATVTPGNAIFGDIIKMRPGESPENYGKIDTTPDISQDIEEADRLYEQAKRMLGITDALQGTEKAVVESGYARELKLNRASIRLESKRRLKYQAYSEIYRLIFEQYLAFADGGRMIQRRDSFGNSSYTRFDRHSFIDKTPDGRLYYSDEYLFSVDMDSCDSYGREQLWQRNLSNLESGTLGKKEEAVTLMRYWRAQERAHYPYARENAEYFAELVRANQQKNENETENDHE